MKVECNSPKVFGSVFESAASAIDTNSMTANEINILKFIWFLNLLFSFARAVVRPKCADK